MDRVNSEAGLERAKRQKPSPEADWADYSRYLVEWGLTEQMVRATQPDAALILPIPPEYDAARRYSAERRRALAIMSKLLGRTIKGARPGLPGTPGPKAKPPA